MVELIIVSTILLMVIGIISGIVSAVQRSYSQQRVRTEALNDATAALDIMTRLVRMAGNNPGGVANLRPIDPGTASGGVYSTIRIRSDWRGSTMSSYPDGDIADPFEDILFFVNNGRLMKQEPTDLAATEFLDNVERLEFRYFDTNNLAVSNPAVNHAQIARIEINIVSGTSGLTPMTFVSSAYVRQRQ